MGDEMNTQEHDYAAALKVVESLQCDEVGVEYGTLAFGIDAAIRAATPRT